MDMELYTDIIYRYELSLKSSIFSSKLALYKMKNEHITYLKVNFNG